MNRLFFIILFTLYSQCCFSQYDIDSTAAKTIQLSDYTLPQKANKVTVVETDTFIVWASYDLIIKSLKNHIAEWDVEEDKTLLKHLHSASKSLTNRMDEINSNPVLKSRLDFITIDLLRNGKCEVYNKVAKQNETHVTCIEYWKQWWTGVRFVTSKNTLLIDVKKGAF